MSADIERWDPPIDPTAFESLCLDLWRDIWHDPNAQKNGRSGQPQAGVDVFGHHEGKWAGVQCKQKDGLLWSKVTVKELEAEVKAAKQFQPLLASFILATTGPRDAKVQKRAREFIEEHKQQGLFSVVVWSWEDIWDELYRRKDLQTRIAPTYWPRLFAVLRSGDTPAPPVPTLTSDRAAPAFAPQRVTIREKSAAEILGNLEGITPISRFVATVNDLYLGRWTPEPGWHTTVHDRPSRLSGGGWFCIFREVGSGTIIGATTVQDLSNFRHGDSVTVSGTIRDVRQGYLESVSLEDAIVRGDNVPVPQSCEPPR
jgi:hypothetical protein